MDKVISKAEDIELTGLDLQRLTKQNTNIRAYHDLENVENIEEILGYKSKACIILYETKENYGHFCSIFVRPENNKVIEFFDPYGNPPDSQLKFATYNLKNNKPYLTYLLDNWKERGGSVIWNNQKLQDWREDVNTCGRWCGTRILLKEKTIMEFTKLFTTNRFYRPDFWVSALTYFYT